MIISYSLILHHSHKENEPTALNGAAPPTRRLRDTSKNPYSKSYCKPLQKQQDLSLSSRAPTSSKASTSMASNPSLSTIEEEEETSPIIRQILEQTGCSSRQEFLAKRAAQEQQQVNTNCYMNRNGSNSTTNRNKSKAATNGAKAATNGTKVSKSTNGSKATNGNKTTNPKKKARSKYFRLTTFDTKIPSLTLSIFYCLASNGSKSTSIKGSKATKTNTNRSKSTNANTNGSKSANGSKSVSFQSHAMSVPSIGFVCQSTNQKTLYCTVHAFTHTSNHISIPIILPFSQCLHQFEF